MAPTMDAMFQNSFIANQKQDSFMCPEESNLLNGNSPHEFAQLAGYLQTRVMPGTINNGNGPNED